MLGRRKGRQNREGGGLSEKTKKSGEEAEGEEGRRRERNEGPILNFFVI